MFLSKLPKVSLRLLRKFFLGFFVLLLVFSGGYFLGKSGFSSKISKKQDVKISRELPQNQDDLDFSLFWKVWDILEENYFDKTKLDPVKMVYGAISGMVSALGDPYTVFLAPSENKVVQEDLQGSFEGIGIQIGFKGTQLAVIAPLPETPAEKAGIKAGDYIIGIKDEKKGVEVGTVGISLPDAVQLIRGDRGTKVTLTLLRLGGDQPLIVDVVREEINVPSVMVNYVGEGEKIAQIKLLKFAGETDGEWEKAVREILKEKQVTQIILDLRNNPGGYLQAAVDIAGDFLAEGTLVVKEETSKGIRSEFKTDRFPKLANYETVILINQGSASASEILAGALREQAKIQLLGEASFGKGTIQEPKQVNSGAGLHITTARWLTPEGVWVNEKGLEPDVKIEDDSETEEDEQLEKAIEILNPKS